MRGAHEGSIFIYHTRATARVVINVICPRARVYGLQMLAGSFGIGKRQDYKSLRYARIRRVFIKLDEGGKVTGTGTDLNRMIKQNTITTRAYLITLLRRKVVKSLQYHKS